MGHISQNDCAPPSLGIHRFWRRASSMGGRDDFCPFVAINAGNLTSGLDTDHICQAKYRQTAMDQDRMADMGVISAQHPRCQTSLRSLTEENSHQNSHLSGYSGSFFRMFIHPLIFSDRQELDNLGGDRQPVEPILENLGCCWF